MNKVHCGRKIQYDTILWSSKDASPHWKSGKCKLKSKGITFHIQNLKCQKKPQEFKGIRSEWNKYTLLEVVYKHLEDNLTFLGDVEDVKTLWAARNKFLEKFSSCSPSCRYNKVQSKIVCNSQPLESTQTSKRTMVRYFLVWSNHGILYNTEN